MTYKFAPLVRVKSGTPPKEKPPKEKPPKEKGNGSTPPLPGAGLTVPQNGVNMPGRPEAYFPTPNHGAGTTLEVAALDEERCVRLSLEMVVVGGEMQPRICVCRWQHAQRGWYPVTYTSLKLKKQSVSLLAHAMLEAAKALP